MNRRSLLVALATPAVPAARADLPKVTSLDDARRWLDRVQAARQPRATGAWPLGSVLEHLAQSIEMSMDGYPQPRSLWFQNTVGSAAFTYFRARGAMRHGLDEPIPGAPPLVAGNDWQAGAKRLRQAIERFEAHTGPLRRHFAYGFLGKGDYALAHSLHIANHQDEIVLA